ncbi:MAG: DUF2868 domain-containing protein, partial [Candidatus Competibacterales bacterium]|nr:DUF2868 domain-containing protein [Candidatus Competibacterales bacterium]
GIGVGLAVLVVLALLAGVSAARLAFWPRAEQPLNVYWLLGSLLGPPLLALLLWIVLLGLRPAALGSGSLGALALALGRGLNRRLHPDSRALDAALRARSALLAQAGGRWLLSAISHGLWLAYLGGVLGMTLVLLSVRQYEFVWETTILSAASYHELTRILGWMPGMLGFPTPDASQIDASRWPDGVVAGVADRAWPGLVLGCLVVYGLLPRLLLLPACLLLYRHACRRWRLDTGLPGYARLQDALQPLTRSLGVVDPEHSDEPGVAGDEATPSVFGPPALLGLEIDPPAEWPPPLELHWQDLGFAEDRASRERILARLAALEPAPERVVVVCSLAMTPDRGCGRFLNDLATTAERPLLVLLSEGQRLRRRGHGADLAQRVADWRTLAEATQAVEVRVLELDLEHLTDRSRRQLAALLGVTVPEARPSRIGAACDLIIAHAHRWLTAPGPAEQAELHRALARLYGNRRDDFRLPLPSLDTTRGEFHGQLQQGAEQVRRLLPARLRTNPRWLTVGALSGAMGCVALATLTAPAALAALPLWSGLGAALTLFTVPAAPATADTGSQTPELGPPVAAAALFMLLLELQGHRETEITHALDEILDEQEPRLDSIEATEAWLDQLRQRHALWQERAPA